MKKKKNIYSYILILFLLFSTFIMPKVTSDSEGYNSPGTIATVDNNGGVRWFFISNAGASDDSYTYACKFVGHLQTDFLVCTNFGFSAIGDNDTIDGILVEVEKHADFNTGSDYVVDEEVQIIDENGVYGEDKGDTSTHWTTNLDTYVSYGGASDTWSDTWTGADIKNSNFGIAFSGHIYNVVEFDGCAWVDHVRIKIYYTPVSAPDITINFAGNLSDSGGPFWRPPGETDLLDEAGEGIWRDGYYTNNSRQSENYIYINCTITDATTVYLDWLNETIWTNGTYALTNTIGNYWDINFSTNLYEGYNYSFNINATGIGGNNIIWWNKTGINGQLTRRYVQLNCIPTNISYMPYYCYDAIYTGILKRDRLNHDQGTDGTITDSGYLNDDIPFASVDNRSCSSYLAYWFDNSVCIEPFTLNNIYIHTWWSADNDELVYSAGGIRYYKTRNWLVSNGYDGYNTTSANNRSSIYYDGPTANDIYFLETRLWILDIPLSFTDNDIYEFYLQFIDIADNISIISNRSFTSFILFNIPNNDTLNISYPDTDSDLLSDWTELYVTYTNPFLADTDNDGVSDYNEYIWSSDPNNYTDIGSAFPPPFVNNVSIASNPIPANSSTNIYLMVTCNVTITDQDGNASICNFYRSMNGIDWAWNQTNSSVLNMSIEFNYTLANINDTLYYWMVTCNDGNDNVSYWFSFTTTTIGVEEMEAIIVELSNPLLLMILWIFTLVIAINKDESVVYWLQIGFGLPLGIYLLWLAETTDLIPLISGVAIIGISIYYVFIGTSMFLKRKKENKPN